MKKSAFLAAVIALHFVLHTHAQSTYTYIPPLSREDGWKTSDLRSRPVDSNRIYRLLEQLHREEHQVHSMLLVHRGELVLEQYFGDSSGDQSHDLRSVTKSITSLLLGIAIDQGFITSVDDPVFNYVQTPLPTKHPDPRKDSLTLRHLVTMSSGLECNDWDKKSKGQEDRVYKQKDWLQYFVNLPMIREPGAESYYCTLGQVLATEAIIQASGMPLEAFAQRYLFDPLGMHPNWGHTSNKEVIASGKRLYMTSRDLAKIGQLVLNQGQWNGKRIVSQTWIRESTAAHTKITGMDYGYLWWDFSIPVNEKNVHVTAATGNGGQYLFIVPAYELVIAFTGGAYNSEADKFPLAILSQVLLPAFARSGQP